MRLLLCYGCLLFALAPALAASPYGDGFASGRLSDYLDSPLSDKVTLQTMDGISGKACLVINENTKVTFKAVEVSPKVKYTLGLRASFLGGESIEENPRFDALLLPGSRPSASPERSLIFLDAQKKPIALWPQMSYRMPFRQWREYSDTFYPPEHAAYMTLVVRAAPGTTLILDDVQFGVAADEGAINVNPEFKNGIYDYSGWSSVASGGKLFESENGKPAFDTRYGSKGALFPISEPGTYSLAATAVSNGNYNFSITLRLLDENGKETGNIRVKGNSTPRHFLLPAGTVKGYFHVYSSLLETLRLTRAGDEASIIELTTK